MADPYSFAESGPMQAQGYLQAQQLNGLAMQKTQAETQHYQALAAQEMQKTAQEKQQADMQKQQQMLMQQVAMRHQGEGLKQQAEAQLGAGFLVGALDSAYKSAQILDQLAKADDSEAQAQGRRIQLKQDAAELLVKVTDGVKLGDQRSFQAHFDALQKELEPLGLRLPPDYRNKVWNEETKAELRASAQTMKEQAAEAHKKVEETRLAERAKHENAKDDAAARASDALAGERKVITENKQKTGGGTAVRAPREDVALAANLLRGVPGVASDLKGKLKDPGASALSEIIADNAQTILQKRPGVKNRAQAVQMAFDEAVANKAIESLVSKEKTLGGFGPDETTTKTSFHPERATGASTTTPSTEGTKESPLKVSDSASYAAVKSGQYYTDPEGNVRRKR